MQNQQKGNFWYFDLRDQHGTQRLNYGKKFTDSYIAVSCSQGTG